MTISLVSNEGQKWRDIMVGWTIDVDLLCQLALKLDAKSPGCGDQMNETKDLQPVGIEHAHLSALNQSYLSTSPRKLVKQLLRIKS